MGSAVGYVVLAAHFIPASCLAFLLLGGLWLATWNLSSYFLFHILTFIRSPAIRPWIKTAFSFLIITSLLIISLYGLILTARAISEFDENQLKNLGTAGDYLGGILNPLIAAAALVALLYTIWIQNKEIRTQRKSHEQQLFNQEFLASLTELHKSKHDITIKPSSNSHKMHGADAFKELRAMITTFRNDKAAIISSDCEEDKIELSKKFKILDEKINSFFQLEELIRPLIHACELASSNPEASDKAYKKIMLRFSDDELYCIQMLSNLPSYRALAPHVKCLEIQNTLGVNMPWPRPTGT